MEGQTSIKVWTDPPAITLIKGETYKLKEGELTPTENVVYYSASQLAQADAEIIKLRYEIDELKSRR